MLIILSICFCEILLTGIKELELLFHRLLMVYSLAISSLFLSFEDAKDKLGDAAGISKLFIEFQKFLYQENVA